MSDDHMKEQYLSAIEQYIANRDETGLHTAYQFGRSALAEGLRSLDIVRMHHEHLSHILAESAARGAANGVAVAASVFLEECLSPYEMALSGFREAVMKLQAEVVERQKAERTLRESEEYFRSLIENSLDIVTILDKDGTIRYQSPSIERVLGYKQTELIGNYVFELVHPDDREMVHATFDSGIKIPGYSAFLEFRFQHKNGTWHILEGSGRNLLNIQGVRGILINSRDITERKKLQERLDDVAQKRAEDLQNFARTIQRAQEEERQRIARELHDDVCQHLSAMRLHMNVLEDDVPRNKRTGRKRLHGLMKQVDDLIEGVRRISTNLRPTALDHFGLVTALRLLCVEFQKTHNIQVDLETSVGVQDHYGMQIDIAIYRITQEALMNAARHSAARRVCVMLSCKEPTLRLVIKDNGRGFEVEKEIRNRQQGFGLIDMRERASSSAEHL